MVSLRRVEVLIHLGVLRGRRVLSPSASVIKSSHSGSANGWSRAVRASESGRFNGSNQEQCADNLGRMSLSIYVQELTRKFVMWSSRLLLCYAAM